MALIKDKILVIEDEKSISYLLGTVLTANGYDVIKAYTGTEACEMLDAYCPDLILLDLGLPDMDGVDIIRRVRSRGTAPIVVVSARTRERDKIEALDLGADDYITKPFGGGELLARVRAALRHARNQVAGPSYTQTGVYRAGELCIDFDRHLVHHSGDLGREGYRRYTESAGQYGQDPPEAGEKSRKTAVYFHRGRSGLSDGGGRIDPAVAKCGRIGTVETGNCLFRPAASLLFLRLRI